MRAGAFTALFLLASVLAAAQPYLARVGPPPLRFSARANPNLPVLKLPPLELPQEAVEPAETAPTPPDPQPEPEAPNPPPLSILELAPPPESLSHSVPAAPQSLPISPQMLLRFFDGASNAPAGIPGPMPGPVPFLPPAAPAAGSRAVYSTSP